MRTRLDDDKTIWRQDHMRFRTRLYKDKNIWGRDHTRISYRDNTKWRKQHIRKRRYEDKKIWGQEDMRTRRYEEKKIWGQEDMRTKRYEDMKLLEQEHLTFLAISKRATKPTTADTAGMVKNAPRAICARLNIFNGHNSRMKVWHLFS